MARDLLDMLLYTSEGLKMLSEDLKHAVERCSLERKWTYIIGKTIAMIPVTAHRAIVHMLVAS